MSDPNYTAPETGSGWNLKVALLFGAVIALIAANVYLFIQLDSTRRDLTRFRESTLTELANLKETASVTTATNRKHIETLKDELEAARRQAAMSVGQAKTEAVKRAEQLTAQLADEQKKQQAKVASEISQVRAQTTETATKVGEVDKDVSGVKTEVATTRAELEKTVAELKSVRGDMGEMSGKIATNGKELNALKALGDRNYFEFSINKTKAPQKIGDIAVLLKKTDQKRNKYTIDVVADDKRVEKKDKNVNEPVQFYVSKARQPYELVVNEIRKDQIVGYLATPKVQQSR